MVSITNIATTTTYFVGAYYEVTSGVATKYYYAGSQRIAMRNNGGLKFLVGDHLGSTSLTTDANGTVVSELRYKAWGEVRYESGTTPTKYTYTGQYSYTSDFGLMFYNARWVDVSLGRFAQADTVVSGGVQGYDRYAYTINNPMRYTDPSGHICVGDNGECRPTDIIAALHVNLSSSLAGTGPGAQYDYISVLGLIPPHHYNLCGDIALEMIYETVTGETGSLGYIYKASRGTGRQTGAGTNAYQVGQQFAGSFPAGWQVVSYYNNYVATFNAGNKNHSSYTYDHRSLTQYSMNEVVLTIAGMLGKGHYVIVGVGQDTTTGYLNPGGVGHWVVVTKVTNNYVYINNPFTNTAQRYTWEEFYKSFRHWIVEIIPAPPPNEMNPLVAEELYEKVKKHNDKFNDKGF